MLFTLKEQYGNRLEVIAKRKLTHASIYLHVVLASFSRSAHSDVMNSCAHLYVDVADPMVEAQFPFEGDELRKRRSNIRHRRRIVNQVSA